MQRFPLHDLVVKSAADLVPLAVHELFRRVVAVPKNGVHKVLGEVARCDRWLANDVRLLVWVDTMTRSATRCGWHQTVREAR